MLKNKHKKIKFLKNQNIKFGHKKFFFIIATLFFIFCGSITLWISTFQIPDLNSFETRKITQSTKIYDRTGKILLYDIHQDIKRTVVPFENISKNIKNATVAIEDAKFYQHGGIKITSIIRSIFSNILSNSFSQGGSTITQQVIKNSLLTTEKTISRKLKEWILSIQLEKVMSKDEILSIYLNSVPYGGNIYGIEEASETFFGKNASALTLAEASYIAAIPKAPTFYSPYGKNKDKLDERQKFILLKMLENNFINQKEYDNAMKEKVLFIPQEKYGIKAPHFVEFIKQYLIDKYGEKILEEKGLKVITTLDYSLQIKTEEITKRKAFENKIKFDAENASVIIIDPKTGQILTMVGSRDYFDKEIDGNFNVALAHRQPGSTFKPFVYATAFKKGYTPDTVLFDLPTEFQTTCTPWGTPINSNVEITSASACYMPENYDNKYLGPISLRNALAQSRNIPSIKVLYLAGIKNSIETAKSMGIKSLSDNPNQYGLTLVLGGGEVSLLDMTSAYGVFANDGVRNSYTGILSVEDLQGKVLEKYTKNPQTILAPNIAETISDILSDNIAKIPAYGANSLLFFPGKNVASKTGTTNNYKDAWSIGYTPEIVVGAWVGNNNNKHMIKKVAGLIVVPLWHEIMEIALENTTGETFIKPPPIDQSIKPILRGFWQGNETYFIDKISGKLATDLTPEETKKEIVAPAEIHSILYSIDKDDPLGSVPINPNNDYQFSLWEYSIQNWLISNPQSFLNKPIAYDNIHIEANKPKIKILMPVQNIEYGEDEKINIMFNASGNYPITKANFYLNNELVGSSEKYPFNLSFIPYSINSFIIGENELKVVVFDSVYNKGESVVSVNIK